MNIQHTRMRVGVRSVISRLASSLPAVPATVPLVILLDVATILKWLVPPTEINGRRFTITVSDLGLRACFVCRNGLFHPQISDQSDLKLEASSADFLSLLRGTADADTLFFNRRLHISGDTELGLIVKNWLDATERPAILMRLLRLRG